MRTGKRIRGEGIELVVSRQASAVSQQSRFAFVVSTKVSKLAVVRNRIRRLMSEAVRLWLKEKQDGKDMSGAIDGTFVVRKELVGLSQKDVERSVRVVLEKLNNEL